ncbi:protein-export protein SecB [bacterium BMS3Abin07]|nr:protein-export protein SecB [bacterium BMS3Abin07]GBE31937.1 protein-export protein SecB [bacterium BMS3Bbin05]HDL20572.1 hypothetical protein [Nitrospirota bacterium]HDO23063.1 hypothetical protein [Nitrospirota bacterium]HDZ88785.1 hypothetical protein [Nitrospirota bacterium]
MPALLDIDEYFVEELTVKSNPQYVKEASEGGEVGISFDIKRKGKEPLFMISMSIKINKSKETFSLVPYRLSLKINGFFSFPEGTDEETIKKMIGLNGLVILYGIARGVVAQATANCLHGKFILPSMNFVELVKKKAHPSKKPSHKKSRKKSG